MSRRVTGEGRLVVMLAGEQARRLGHGFLGCEHLLYGVASVDSEAGMVLRARGITPQRYEEEFVNLVGPHRPAGAGDAATDPFDREALAAIGIDIDAVRERIEATFGPGALTRADNDQARRRFGRSRRAGIPSGHLPLTRRAKKCLGRALRNEQIRHSRHLVPEEIALALLTTNRGLVPRILSALGTCAPDLRTEILHRYQPAR
jgi:Clp amino terminal domain, pathogenicity island component